MIETNNVNNSNITNDRIWDITESELDIPIWRYMDFSKYMDILENSCLFFSTINGFEDRLEGFNNALIEGISYKLDTSGGTARLISTKEQLTHPVEIDNAVRIKTFLKVTEANYKASIGVSCWRIDPFESHSMWKSYVKSNEGVAIKSSVRLIKDSVQLKHLQNLKAIKIQYTDYDTEVIDMIKSVGVSVYHKSKYFEYEKELRFIFNEIISENPYNCKSMSEPGINIPINTNKFINEVIVSPYAPIWFFSLVNKISRHYGLSVPVTMSGIQLR